VEVNSVSFCFRTILLVWTCLNTSCCWRQRTSQNPIPVCSEIWSCTLWFDYFHKTPHFHPRHRQLPFRNDPPKNSVVRPTLANFSHPQFKNPGFKLNDALHFVEPQGLRAGLLPCLYHGVVSKTLFFRDNIVRIFPSRVRNAQPYTGNRKRITFTAWFSNCRWAEQDWAVFVTSLLPDGSIEPKGRNEKGMQYGKVLTNARFKKTYSSFCSVALLRPCKWTLKTNLLKLHGVEGSQVGRDYGSNISGLRSSCMNEMAPELCFRKHGSGAVFFITWLQLCFVNTL